MYLGNAKDVLNDQFKKVQFSAYYLDGCSGSSSNLIDIIQSIFTNSRLKNDDIGIDKNENDCTEKFERIENFAIGFTITNAGD
jgi:hypothetical protein